MLEAALSLFAARNFASVSTSDIANATGFNPALIYYYFGNKEELFRRAIALAVERAFQRFELSRKTASTPAEAVFDWIDTHISAYDTIDKLMSLSIDYAGTAHRKAAVDRTIRKFYDDERDVLRQALEAGIKAGEFRPVNAGEMAAFISTYLDGVFVRAMILKDFKPVLAIKSLNAFLRAQLQPMTKDR